MTPFAVFVLSALSAMLYVLAITTFVALHWCVQETSWMREPVSNYAVGIASGYFRAYGHVGTLAATLLALLFAMSTTPSIPVVAVVSMLLTVVFRFGAVLVPTGGPDNPASPCGRLHLFFAVANFAASYTVIANASPVLEPAAPAWLSIILFGTRWAAMLSLTGVVVTMTGPAKPVFGVFERIFLLAIMLWFLAGNIYFLATAGPM